MTEQLLTVPDVAARLAISRTGVYDLFRAGVLPSVAVGSRRRVKTSDLDAYIDRISKAA